MRGEVLISELENAIASRSGNTGQLVRQIADLFFVHAGSHSAKQLGLYDRVFEILLKEIEVKARIELAERLAEIHGAPPATIRSLALDDTLAVAKPVLARSPDLMDATLSECILEKGTGHHLAIASRVEVSEAVSDRLIARGDKEVLATLARNEGARISDSGYAAIVERSADDERLIELLALRKDIPHQHFRELLSKASSVVRQRIAGENPNVADVVGDIKASHAPHYEQTNGGRVLDYRIAETVLSSQRLTEAVVVRYAQAKRLEEVIVAIAMLSGLPRGVVETAICGTWSTPTAVVLKALGFQMATVEAIYLARPSADSSDRDGLVDAKRDFVALKRATAERVLRFIKARASAGAPQEIFLIE